MTQKHNSFKRIVRRCREELRATKKIADVESVGGAIITFITKLAIQAINRGYLKEGKTAKKLLLRKHKVMRSYFRKTFSDFLKKYNDHPLSSEAGSRYKNVIWLCWWQGEENAPEITKRCIESVRRNAEGHTVVVVNEQTYKQYVQMPDWVEKKYKAGVISRTHYSDILRLFLLSAHGGIWIDATMYCAGAGLGSYLKLPLWTMKRPGCDNLSISAGRFVTGCMGCDWEHRWVFAAIRDFLLHYWETSDLLIDYLVFDYMIDLAISNNCRIEEAFANIEPNNPNGIELLKVMGKPFDPTEWERIRKETVLFILSWKSVFPARTEGTDTFYGKVLKGEL